MNDDKQLWQLTVAEFINLLREENLKLIEEISADENEYVFGLAGLAQILGCSRNHAGKLKSSGIFDDAIKQKGRLIIVDKAKAL